MKLILVFILSCVSFSKCYRHGRHSSRHSPCASTIFPPDPASGCCGVDTSNTNLILGGKKTQLRQYPWLALIEYKNDDGSYEDSCDGALISAVFVLTAAHCVAKTALEQGTKPISVRFGEYDKSNRLRDRDCVYHGRTRDCTDGAIRIPIESYIAHPMYETKRQKNDIAIVKLAKRVFYTDSIRPICLPSSDVTEDPPQDLSLWVAGWGVMHQRHYDNGRSRDDIDTNIKRHVEVPFWRPEKCMKRWRIVNGEKQICAGGDGAKGTCMGDSGGPLMHENQGVYEIVGIVSFGSGNRCAKLNTPDIYTKVFAYKDWVNEVMEQKRQEYLTRNRSSRDISRNYKY